ncbi:MAG TPA: hypothetical protein VGP33_17410, partial [Chloroflexota bacterium]|nr:hypothetical protein [Chloroflexota bacterium]
MDDDYSTLDLTALCNVDSAAIPATREPALGRQQFHGLPFAIGSTDGEGRSFLVLGGADGEPRRLPVGRTARHLIFVHRLLESELLGGGPMGTLVAEYVIQYADGGEARLPIRERLEIAVVPSQWGQWPLLALPDHSDTLLPRYQGQWSHAGARQTEAVNGNARDYYLWPWTNPRPDCEIAAIEILPSGPRFLLAAITLGLVDEDPFTREG